MYRFAYFTGDLLIILCWIYFFWKRKDLRLEMLFMSKLTLLWIAISYVFFAPIFLTQVWTPESIGILHLPFGVTGEDIVFTFFLGGVAAVIYEEFFGRKHLKKKRIKLNTLYCSIFPIILFLSLFIGIYMFHINPYYACYLGFIIGAATIWFVRKDLLLHSILSGALLGFLYFIFFAFFFNPLFPHVVQRWWHLTQLSGIIVLGVPLEEILWAYSFGLFIGPSYEFLMGIKDKQ